MCNVLMRSSTVIQHLLTQPSSSPPTAVAYVYCNEHFRHKENLRSLLGSFIMQLLIQQSAPEITAVQSLYANCRELTPTADLLNSFIGIIEKIRTSFSKVYLVVDGLDEFTNRLEILSLINRLLNMNKFNILVASRPEHEFEKAFVNNHRLNIEENLVSEDISSYVTWQLENDEKLSKIKPVLKDEIKARLISQSHGMYFIFPTYF